MRLTLEERKKLNKKAKEYIGSKFKLLLSKHYGIDYRKVQNYFSGASHYDDLDIPGKVVEMIKKSERERAIIKNILNY